MPPKARITKDMIVNAAFELTEAEGIGMVNARSIAKRLSCSTQPILYYFSGMDEVKKAVYQKADDFHTAFITDVQGKYPNPLLEIGMRYIEFAVTYKELFKFLFQSDQFAGRDLSEIIGAEELLPVLQMMAQAMKLPLEQARNVFERIFFNVHGIASLLANNRATYDEEHIRNLLRDTFVRATGSARKEGEE
ncbi:MAG: TetR/AcrR family transcriptional regulator [Eubacteriales bacterium]|nr:TetR/AcrR family transcriptional regulator [Eubacteriales bacterium]